MPKVIATAAGFHGGARRRPNAVFHVKEGERASWFKPVPPDTPDEAEVRESALLPAPDNPPRPKSRRMRDADAAPQTARAQTDPDQGGA